MKAKCANCEWQGDESDVRPIADLEQRVAAGEEMPCGECPECGALCHVVQDNRTSTIPLILRGLVVDAQRAREVAKSPAEVQQWRVVESTLARAAGELELYLPDALNVVV